MADFDLVTCNLIIEATGQIIGIYDIPRHMDKLAWFVGGEQHVVGGVHMHGDTHATAFLVPGNIELENRPTSERENLYVDLFKVSPND